MPRHPPPPEPANDFEEFGPATQPQPSLPLRASESAHPETERALSIPVPQLDTRATLTVISGAGSGRVVVLNHRDTLLGGAPTAELSFEDPAVSRAHARIAYDPAGYIIEDLGSANGTFVGGERVTRARLESGDRFQLGPSVVLRFALTDKLERDLLIRLVESSTRDPLTGAFNRSFFAERLSAEIAYAQRHGTKVAVLMADLDHFKAINDTHGHAVGDDVLRAVACEMGRILRAEDVLARYGGEEFVILARAATRLDAWRMAERLRTAVAGTKVILASGDAVTVTISVGIARLGETPDGASTPVQLLKLADARLYRAKASGRNAICMVD